MAELYYYCNFTYPAQQFGGELGLDISFDSVTPPAAVQIGTDSDWEDVVSPAFTNGFVGLKTDGSIWGAGDNSADYIHGPSSVLYATADLGYGILATNLYSPRGTDTGNDPKGIYFRGVDSQLYFIGQYDYAGLGVGPPFQYTSPAPVTSLPTGSVFSIEPLFSGANRATVDGVQYAVYEEATASYNLGTGAVNLYDDPYLGGSGYIPASYTFTPMTYPFNPVQWGSQTDVELFTLDDAGVVRTHLVSSQYIESGFTKATRVTEAILSDVAYIHDAGYGNGLFYITTAGELRYINTASGVLYDEVGGSPEPVITVYTPVTSYPVYPGVEFDRVYVNQNNGAIAARVASTREIYVWDLYAINPSYGNLEDLGAILPFPAPVEPLPGVPVANIAFNTWSGGTGLFLVVGVLPGGATATQFWENLRSTTQY